MGDDNLNHSKIPMTQNQNNAMSKDDLEDGHRLTRNPEQHGGTPVEKKPPHDAQNQATIEEFGEEGMGVAAKE